MVRVDNQKLTSELFGPTETQLIGRDDRFRRFFAL